MRIHQNNSSVCADHHHRIRCGIQQAAEKFFDALAVGNVSDHGAHQQPIRTLHRAKADFDWELGAVLAHPVKFQAGPHRPQLRAAHKTRAVSAMFSPEPFRYENLDGLVDQFGAIVTEQFFCLGVHHHNAAFLADNHNPIRRVLHQRHNPIRRVLHQRFVDGIADCGRTCRHSSSGEVVNSEAAAPLEGRVEGEDDSARTNLALRKIPVKHN